MAADRQPVPALPLRIYWSVDIAAGVSAPPASDDARAYIAMGNARIAALALSDGRELWRVSKQISAPMAASGGLLFISAGDAVEALRGDTGATAWIAPRLTATVPLVASDGLIVAVTASEIVALHPADGRVVWRHAAGGVRVPPVVDGTRVFVGADDGRILALDAGSGAVAWEAFVGGGVTALGAGHGLVYAGAGDKQFHCLDARGKTKWTYRIGSSPAGRIAVDRERVYFAAGDNVIRALDRETGNQRWQAPLTRRPVGGARLAGHLVFVQVIGTEMIMLLDRNGGRSGAIVLPGETTRETPPDVREAAAGVYVLLVTGGLSNQWQVTLIGPAAEDALAPFGRLAWLPGVPFLTDPILEPVGRVLPWLILGEPMLRPLSGMDWPIVLRDPRLEPLTTLPGIQLRPLSPVLPVRRGG
jgi:outer membrane protein assembly factor BamB